MIVRTLDAGADKPLPFLPQAPEDNPFLGVRGIRVGLAHPELLRTQLQAIATVADRHPSRSCSRWSPRSTSTGRRAR